MEPGPHPQFNQAHPPLQVWREKLGCPAGAPGMHSATPFVVYLVRPLGTRSRVGHALLLLNRVGRRQSLHLRAHHVRRELEHQPPPRGEIASYGLAVLRCIRPAGSSRTSAETSTTSRGPAVPSAQAPPLVLNGRRLERNRKFVDSPLEGTGFELLVAGAVKLVVAPFDAPGCLGTGPQPAERRDRALRE